MENLSVSKCVTKVYQAARDGSSDLEDLLIQLKTTEQRKTALETKTKDGSHFVTPLIIAAHNGHLNSVKILLSYKADIEARGTLKTGLQKIVNINVVTITTEFLAILILFFGKMVQESILSRPNYIEDAFEKLVAASEKRTEKLKSKNSQEEQEKTLYCALCLLMIHTKVKGQNANMTDFLQRFLRLNPRTNDGNTLLHLATWHETPIFLNADKKVEEIMQSVCKLPCVETMKLILHAGCDVNAVNTEGNTPLHLAVTFKPADPEEVVILSEMLLLLLDIGADPKLVNKNGQTPLHSCETDEARRILSEKSGLSAMNVDVGDVREV